jgi:hypothetical protein
MGSMENLETPSMVCPPKYNIIACAAPKLTYLSIVISGELFSRFHSMRLSVGRSLGTPGSLLSQYLPPLLFWVLSWCEAESRNFVAVES